MSYTKQEISKILIANTLSFLEQNNIDENSLVSSIHDKLNKHYLTIAESTVILSKYNAKEFDKLSSKISSLWVKDSIRPNLSFGDAGTMNINEAIAFINNQMEKTNSDINSFMNNLYNEFSNGHIYARDLHFFADLLQINLNEEFLEETIKMNRYYPNIAALLDTSCHL